MLRGTISHLRYKQKSQFRNLQMDVTLLWDNQIQVVSPCLALPRSAPRVLRENADVKIPRMRLHQFSVAPLVPNDSLLCIGPAKKYFWWAGWDIFYLGLVQPSSDLFTSDGASLSFNGSQTGRCVGARGQLTALGPSRPGSNPRVARGLILSSWF